MLMFPAHLHVHTQVQNAERGQTCALGAELIEKMDAEMQVVLLSIHPSECSGNLNLPLSILCHEHVLLYVWYIYIL